MNRLTLVLPDFVGYKLASMPTIEGGRNHQISQPMIMGNYSALK